jgi:hypothetical protein
MLPLPVQQNLFGAMRLSHIQANIQATVAALESSRERLARASDAPESARIQGQIDVVELRFRHLAQHVVWN